MKKQALTAIIAAQLLSGCAMMAPSAPYAYCSTIDYTTLTDKGIFVTESNSVNFDYKSIESITAESVSGWSKKKGDYQREECSAKEAFDLIVEELQSIEADGLINLKFEYIPKTERTESKVIVSGMAIKKL
jgi:hypothetical protein